MSLCKLYALPVDNLTQLNTFRPLPIHVDNLLTCKAQQKSWLLQLHVRVTQNIQQLCTVSFIGPLIENRCLYKIPTGRFEAVLFLFGGFVFCIKSFNLVILYYCRWLPTDTVHDSYPGKQTKLQYTTTSFPISLVQQYLLFRYIVGPPTLVK